MSNHKNNINIMEPVTIPMTNNSNQKVSYAYMLSKTIKMICLIDCIFSLLFLFINPYALIYTLVLYVCSYFAYTGAKMFSKCRLIPYIIINILKNIACVFLIYLYREQVDFVVIESIYLLIGTYITYLIMKFYVKVSGLDETQLEQARNFNRSYIVTFV